MSQQAEAGFPGGSKGRVNRAGERVRSGAATAEDVAVINAWRVEHRHVLDSFREILRDQAARFGGEVAIAQRHKRRNTIFDKLHRLPGLKLSQLQDVAGCRLVFDDIEGLRGFRQGMHAAGLGHALRGDADRYDYIRKPKQSGYRGIHDVYVYHGDRPENRHCTGLFVELQYRTEVQHAWAMAVEVVGFVTAHEPKFNRGDEDYKRILRLASEILARAWENMTSSLAEMGNGEVVEAFLGLDERLRFMELLRGLNAVRWDELKGRHFILALGREQEIDILPYWSMAAALESLPRLEERRPNHDIVLVQGDRARDLRGIFQSYFGDVGLFLRKMEEGVVKVGKMG